MIGLCNISYASVTSSKTSIQLEEEGKQLLCMFTDMQLDDLKEYVKSQNKGRSR